MIGNQVHRRTTQLTENQVADRLTDRVGVRTWILVRNRTLARITESETAILGTILGEMSEV